MGAIRNPFKYGVRVSGSSFFDRTKVKRAMLNTLDGGSNNVPYYLQALGSWVFNAMTGRNAKSVSRADIDEGFTDLYETERILLEDTFTAHSQSQRLLMRALATESATIFNEDYRNRHALASTSTVNTALRRLLSESTIECDSGIYGLANPLLSHHLARQV